MSKRTKVNIYTGKTTQATKVTRTKESLEKAVKDTRNRNKVLNLKTEGDWDIELSKRVKALDTLRPPKRQ